MIMHHAALNVCSDILLSQQSYSIIQFCVPEQDVSSLNDYPKLSLRRQDKQTNLIQTNL